MVPLMLPPLRHLLTAQVLGLPDLTVQLWDGESAGISAPPGPVSFPIETFTFLRGLSVVRSTII